MTKEHTGACTRASRVTRARPEEVYSAICSAAFARRQAVPQVFEIEVRLGLAGVDVEGISRWFFTQIRHVNREAFSP
jgi:hypothetical protein